MNTSAFDHRSATIYNPAAMSVDLLRESCYKIGFESENDGGVVLQCPPQLTLVTLK